MRLGFGLVLFRVCSAAYTLQDAYMASNFFDMFNFFTGPDPTQGYVNFVNQQTARAAGMITQSNTSVAFGVDHQTVNPQGGRSSLRLESKNTYDQGLIVVDLAHMPGGICGTWPAFWTIGPDWPQNGEIDIIEGVNSQSSNAMTLHTAAGCSINSAGKQRFSGSIKTSNCDTNAPGQGTNVGCGIGTVDTTTYGTGFNNVSGGVYATEWTADTISIYHFARSDIPSDLNSDSPDPSTWGEPLAVFNGCNFGQAVKNQTIIFDTTFCGQWAGQDAVWQADPVCSQKAATCQDYVSNNPADFVDAYWEVNYLKVYQLQQSSGNTSQSAPPTPQPTSTSVLPGTTSSQPPTFIPTGSEVLPSSVPTTRTLSTMISSSSAVSSHTHRPTSTAFVTVNVTATLTIDGTTATSGQTAPTGSASSTTGCNRHSRAGCISQRPDQKSSQGVPNDCAPGASGGCISRRTRTTSIEISTRDCSAGTAKGCAMPEPHRRRRGTRFA